MRCSACLRQSSLAVLWRVVLLGEIRLRDFTPGLPTEGPS